MNWEEKIVNDYLYSEGFKNIHFEPDGNMPPDFSIENSIAIEVRRLNENYFAEGRVVGTYEDYYSFWDFLPKFLDNYINPNLNTSYLLSFYYRRPLPEFSKLKRSLKLALDKFVNNPTPNIEITIKDSIVIKLTPDDNKLQNKIHLASTGDNNGGGFVIPIYLSNINYCIEEKTDKIKDFHYRYENWWLILVDRIVYGIRPTDIEKIAEEIKLNHLWSKLIILDPNDKVPIIEI